jgi:hypothetical protein
LRGDRSGESVGIVTPVRHRQIVAFMEIFPPAYPSSARRDEPASGVHRNVHPP